MPQGLAQSLELLHRPARHRFKFAHVDFFGAGSLILQILFVVVLEVNEANEGMVVDRRQLFSTRCLVVAPLRSIGGCSWHRVTQLGLLVFRGLVACGLRLFGLRFCSLPGSRLLAFLGACGRCISTLIVESLLLVIVSFVCLRAVLLLRSLLPCNSLLPCHLSQLKPMFRLVRLPILDNLIKFRD